MESSNVRHRRILGGSMALRVAMYCSVVALLGNLNAIVDSFLHPEIPYFDEEHLIVGGITGLVSAVLFGLILVYTRHLERALGRIAELESFLPICSGCKKIRVPDSSEGGKEFWQPIDSYIAEHTDMTFSHGLCPECSRKIYPEFAGD